MIPPGFPGAGGFFPVGINRECVGLYSPNCGSPGSAGPNSAPGSLQPEFTWNARATLGFENVDVSLLWRHIDSMRVEPDIFPHVYNCEEDGPITTGALAGECLDFTRIKAFDYFDLATRFDVTENLDVTLTVTNLLDKRPPIVGSTIGSVSFNSGNTYPSTYDALGRRFAIGARLKF